MVFIANILKLSRVSLRILKLWKQLMHFPPQNISPTCGQSFPELQDSSSEHLGVRGDVGQLSGMTPRGHQAASPAPPLPRLAEDLP